MIVYISVLIPITAILVLYFFFRTKLHWGEALGLLAVPLILIFSLKAIAIHYSTTDTEWYGGYAVQATYYEDWDEYIHKTCSYTTCSGSGKSRSCSTYYYDCSYVDYHPEYWWLTDNNNRGWGISKGRYEELTKRWGNKTFVDLHRHYYSNDGDAYVTVFNNDFNTLEPTTAEGSYENRVAVSSSIFNFRDIDPKGLVEYPKVSGYSQQCLIGVDDYALDLKLQKINGLLGASKQVRIYILVWHNQPLDKAFDQQQYWKNGNKNELVINIGVDDSNKINWAYVFSWTPSEDLKVGIRNHLQGTQLDINSLLDWLPSQVEQKWVRKNFTDFAYIAVEPSTGWCVAIFLITLLTTVGL